MKLLSYLKLQGIGIKGFFKSLHVLLFGSIKQPVIFYGHNHVSFARWYKLKRELLYHREWNQMGKAQFILRFVPGKLIVCSKLELEIYKKRGLIPSSASIKKITNKAI